MKTAFLRCLPFSGLTSRYLSKSLSVILIDSKAENGGKASPPGAISALFLVATRGVSETHVGTNEEIWRYSVSALPGQTFKTLRAAEAALRGISENYQLLEVVKDKANSASVVKDYVMISRNVFFILLLFYCCLLPFNAYSVLPAVSPSEGEVEYWETSISVSAGHVYYRSDTKLETEWLACQGFANQLTEVYNSPFVTTTFELVASLNGFLCKALDTAYPDHREGTVFLRAWPKIENRTDNCPDSHPIYNQMTNLCAIDQSRNMGPSICSLGTNPINGFTGNKYQVENIYLSRNSPGLEFKWFYNSMVGENQGNWRHCYQVSIDSNLALKVNETASYAGNLPTKVIAIVMTEDGNIYKYRNDISWSTRSTMTELWRDVSNNGGRRLETVTDQENGRAVGFRFYARGNRIEEFSLNGRLQKITSDSKNQIQIAWVNDRVDSVTDEFGNTIQFHYDDISGLLMDILVDGGVYYRFSYQDKLLASVTYPDGTPQIATDNPSKQYKYEDPMFPGYLTSVIDENGNTSARWSYDDQGRAISSSHADDSYKHTLSYDADGSTTITDALGSSRKYTFANIDSLIRIESSTGGECKQCGASSKAYEYDSNGFVTSKTDWNGAKTVYTRNDLGQELSRTVAIGLPEERVVTTEWHPLFHAPVRITEGGRITEYSYDEDGRLLKKTERATH